MDHVFYDDAGMVDLLHIQGAFAIQHWDEDIEEQVYGIAFILIIGEQVDRFLFSYTTAEARDAALQRLIAQHQNWSKRHSALHEGEN